MTEPVSHAQIAKRRKGFIENDSHSLVKKEGLSLLIPASEPVDLRISKLGVLLTHAAVHSLAPQVETAAFEFFPHQPDHIGFGIPELRVDGFERRAVFPRHFNDSIGVGLGHIQ